MSTINTLKEFLNLRATGIPENQAIVQVEAMFDMVDFKIDGLATKEDISALALATKSDISALALATKSDISGVLKDIFYIKLMLVGIFVLGAMPIIQQYLHFN
jgi:hypothetical protein